MRITDLVSFFYVNNGGAGSYDPETGEYRDNVIKPLLKLPANVTDLGANTEKQLFGEITDRRLVIRTFHAIDFFYWTFCSIGDSDTKYKQEAILNVTSHSSTIIVGEMHDQSRF